MNTTHLSRTIAAQDNGPRALTAETGGLSALGGQVLGYAGSLAHDVAQGEADFGLAWDSLHDWGAHKQAWAAAGRGARTGWMAAGLIMQAACEAESLRRAAVELMEGLQDQSGAEGPVTGDVEDAVGKWLGVLPASCWRENAEALDAAAEEVFGRRLGRRGWYWATKSAGYEGLDGPRV